MKIEYKEGLIVLKDQDEEVGYIKYVRFILKKGEYECYH